MADYGVADRSLDVQAPALRARGTILRAVEPPDLPSLYRQPVKSHTGFRWRHRGTTLSPEDFESALWNAVFAQFIIAREADPSAVLGLVTSYGAHPRDGYVNIAVVVEPPARGTMTPMIGMGLFFDYLFKVGGFRKLYFEATEFNLSQYARAIADVFACEGVARQHEFYDGCYWDVYTMALFADSTCQAHKP